MTKRVKYSFIIRSFLIKILLRVISKLGVLGDLTNVQEKRKIVSIMKVIFIMKLKN